MYQCRRFFFPLVTKYIHKCVTTHTHTHTHKTHTHSHVQTTGHSSAVRLCSPQEDLGHRELCVAHLAEEHAGEGPEEGHWLPHEEEPITAGAQAEGAVLQPGPHQLPGGAQRAQVLWRKVLQCHHDGMCVCDRHRHRHRHR